MERSLSWAPTRGPRDPTDREVTSWRRTCSRAARRCGPVRPVAWTRPGPAPARGAAARPLGGGAAGRRCILLCLCGAPSPLDTWALKPDAPEGIRGPYKPAATAVPGLRLCELHTRLAPLAGHFA